MDRHHGKHRLPVQRGPRGDADLEFLSLEIRGCLRRGQARRSSSMTASTSPAATRSASPPIPRSRCKAAPSLAPPIDVQADAALAGHGPSTPSLQCRVAVKRPARSPPRRLPRVSGLRLNILPRADKPLIASSRRSLPGRHTQRLGCTGPPGSTWMTFTILTAKKITGKLRQRRQQVVAIQRHGFCRQLLPHRRHAQREEVRSGRAANGP